MKHKEVEHLYYKKVKISNVCYQRVLATVEDVIETNKRGYICLTDVSNLIAASKDEELQSALNSSLFSLSDGTPVAWYARLAGCSEIERISGASLMRGLFADLHNCRHYLLGDTEQTIKRVIAEAKKINSSIDISGHSPPFKVFDYEDNREMIKKIHEARPDIIWVSFGGWKQEKWMQQHLNSLDRGVMIGVGAAFRFLIGDIVTPPLIFQKMGMQWFFRLMQHLGRDPADWWKIVRERQILKTKREFLATLPEEVLKARRQLKALKSTDAVNSV